ncbi:MAG: MFS transporter [Alicyclobacillus sp.]|nr:MFS transporter [Alicyclobacillus sp.]
MAAREINVAHWINERKLSGYQWAIFILCALIGTLDGFDLQAVSFAAPVVAKLWHAAPTAMAPVFSAGLFGLMIGALLSGPVADRVGRRTVILGSVFLFGLFSVLTAFVHSVDQLLWLRLLTGLGLGGSMPNIITLVAEYAPERIRKTAVSTMFSGVPFGGFIGAVLASWLIPAFGWESIFYAGGIIPLVIGLVAWGTLPESIRFLVLNRPDSQKVAKILQRMDANAGIDANTHFVLQEEKSEGIPVKELFRHGNAANTIFLWVVFFMSLLIIYFTTNWLPTVLHNVGLPLDKAILGVASLQGGGVLGSILIGSAGDKFNVKKVLVWTFILGAIGLALVGSGGSLGLTMFIIFAVGFLCVGGQCGINALAAVIYPTAARSTGVGWALGAGRVGSIIGPLIGGVIISWHWTLQQIYFVAAVPALLAALAMMFIRIKNAPESAHQAPVAKADLRG